jgi:hypothetical protein
MLVDLVNQTVRSNNLGPKTLTGTSQGNAADFANAHIDTAALIDVGTLGAAMTSVDVQIEESATTTGPWTVIPAIGGGNMAVHATTAGSNAVKGQRSHRYVRANAVTVTGQTLSVPVNVEIIAEAKFAGTGGGYSRSPST